MKIVDKNGKLFGKISILDIVIVAVIAFLGVVFIMNKADKIELPVLTKTDTEYTVRFKAYNVTATEQIPFNVGEKLYASTGEYIGEITEVSWSELETKEKLHDGTYFTFKNPRSRDYYITVKGKGSSNDKGVFAQGTFAMFPNNSQTVSSRYFYGNVVVLSVEK